MNANKRVNTVRNLYANGTEYTKIEDYKFHSTNQKSGIIGFDIKEKKKQNKTYMVYLYIVYSRKYVQVCSNYDENVIGLKKEKIIFKYLCSVYAVTPSTYI